MGIMDYFKSVSTWSAQKVREFLRERNHGEYNLVDVRQPAEYEKGHLPGARLMPVGQLADRLEELDQTKTTIIYCATGVRSRAAASILERSGFEEVRNMTGGFNAWQGFVAEGFPEAGIPWFAAARSTNELTALAWILEEGTRAFYAKIAQSFPDRDATSLFFKLVSYEEQHMEALRILYRDLYGGSGDVDFPALLGRQPREATMEGGMRLDDALVWAQGKEPKDILEFSISLETGSYDRYLAMYERVSDKRARAIFRSLADEEKLHLERLAEMFEKML